MPTLVINRPNTKPHAVERARKIDVQPISERSPRNTRRTRFRENDIVEARHGTPIDESEFDCCVLLWHSVIVQAFYDLANQCEHTEAKLIRAQAASWFAGGEDFETVLELAMVSKVQIAKMAKRILLGGRQALEGFNLGTVRKENFTRKAKRVRC